MLNSFQHPSDMPHLLRHYYVYILTNKPHGILYIGITNHIGRRVFQHKFGVENSFTHKYKISRLVHLEQFTDISLAIKREKQLKSWHRSWKINLIQQDNPRWNDLSTKNVQMDTGSSPV